MVTIRRFKRGDIFTVMRIVNDIFQEDYDPGVLLNFYTSWQEGFLVAEESNDIIGLVVGSLPAPRQARILILAVEEPYRRKGIGTRLLQAFIRECIAKDIRLISLEVRVNNSAAIEFYKTFGFGIVQTIPHYYRDGLDGYVMHKLL